MDSETVLIEDDDVDMEPVVNDEDKINSDNTNVLSRVETIDLDDDDEPSNNNGIENLDNDVIIISDKKEQCSKKSDKPTNKSERLSKKAEKSLMISLKNNTLMDKIVTRCLTMENASGMPRVINKTVLPLYRDVDIRFKESGAFRKLLRRTYKMLKKDPDHKFLHVKTLCEQLKSGVCGRRKVPFVTLARNITSNGSQLEQRALNSSSRSINENSQQEHNIVTQQETETNKNNRKRKHHNTNGTIVKIKAIKNLNPYNKVKKDKIQTTTSTDNLRNKTDVISIDNSDDESIISVDNDIIVIDEVIPSGNENHNSGIETQEEKDDSNKSPEDNNCSKENNEAESESINLMNNDIQKEQDNECDTDKVSEEENDSNKENNEETPENCNLPYFDFEHLIPQNHVEIVVAENSYENPSVNNNRVKEIEHEILIYKRMVAELEETEVTDDYSSAYIQCARLKRKIVKLYKQLCKVNGYSEDIVKRQEIRLLVAENHPSGPAKRLEHFLNTKFDNTGIVAFPDFSDVVKCVLYSNFVDKLGWDKKRIFQEAAALFRQCGQALRKRRQKREYKDLLSLVQDKEHAEDPAENDPLLLAKLEQNKQIAKVKEEEILERFVNMERNVLSKADNRCVGNPIEFDLDQDSSDSDSESELNVQLRNISPSSTNNGECATGKTTINNMNNNKYDLLVHKITDGTINNHYSNGETSKSSDVIHNSLSLETANSSIPVTSAVVNDKSRTREGSQYKDSISNNLEPTPKNITTSTVTNNQCASRESSIINNIFVYDYTMHIMPLNNIVVSAPSLSIYNSGVPVTLDGSVAIINNDIQIEQGLNSNDTTTNNLYVPTRNVDVVHPRINQDKEITLQNNCIAKQNVNSGKDPDMQESSMFLNNISCLPNEVVQNEEVSSTIKRQGDEVKLEDIIKKEPLDIQNMLNELGDNFVCKILDIEDPFLVIEISSDGFSDDD